MTEFGSPVSAIQPPEVLVRVVVTVGFWAAVVLGLAAVPVAILGGTRSGVLAGLIGLEVGCLLVGHRHEPTDAINFEEVAR